MIKALAASLFFTLSASAIADTRISYRSEGGCAGDFDRVELKDHRFRADSHQGENDGSMIYDGAEKLAYFVDHRTRTFMQIEMDEDAIDLQSDVMKSLRTKMRKESGFDPFEMAKSLCPGLSAANARDRTPDDPIDCGNGTTLGGADGKPMNRDAMASAMKDGRMPGVDAESLAQMQKLMQEQMASLPPEQQAEMQRMMGGAASPSQNRSPAPQRIDRDAGEAKVGDIVCTRREHLRGDEMLREDCYAPAAALALGDVETRRIARITKTMQDWSRSLAPDAGSAADDRVLVRRVCYAGGHESGRATLVIDRAPIEEARFEMPSGYAPMSLNAESADGAERRR